MAKNHYFSRLIFGCTLLICTASFGQTGLNKPVPRDSAIRELVISLAKKEVGVVEKTGHNDHPRIVEYHRSVSAWLANYRPAQPYCASFVNYILKKAGVVITGVKNPARARDWFTDKSRIVMTQQSLRGNRRMMIIPKKGSLVGYIFYSNSISHVEILDKIDLDEGYVYCIGANTTNRSAANSVVREGTKKDKGGVYWVKRKISMIHAIADMI